jgi:hypothetical protein
LTCDHAGPVGQGLEGSANGGMMELRR